MVTIIILILIHTTLLMIIILLILLLMIVLCNNDVRGEQRAPDADRTAPSVRTRSTYCTKVNTYIRVYYNT